MRNTEGRIYLPLIYRNFVGNASVPLIRQSCIKKVGNYNELLRKQNAQGCEDWDLQLRIAEYYQFKVVPKFLVGYRQLSNSMTKNHAQMIESYDSVMKDVRARHPKIPEYVYNWSKSHFYNYLLDKIHKTENFRGTVTLLAKIIRADIKIMLKKRIYFIFIWSVLKNFLPKAIITKIYNSKFYLSSNNRFLSQKQILSQIEQIAELEKSVQSFRSGSFKGASLYQMLLIRRWQKILKLNKLEDF